MTREKHETQDEMTERLAAEVLARMREVVEKALGGSLPDGQQPSRTELSQEAQDAFNQGWALGTSQNG